MRTTFLQETAMNLEDRADRRHIRVKRMIKDKAQRRMYRKMHKINGKARKGGLSTMTVTEEGSEIHKAKEHEIVSECIKEARARFKQMEDTSLMTQPLVTDFGYLATSEAAGQVWEGTYTAPPDSDKYAVKLIKEL